MVSGYGRSWWAFISIHYFFPKAWKKCMLCIKTCPFKVHSLVKGRKTCKLAFSMQYDKSYDKRECGMLCLWGQIREAANNTLRRWYLSQARIRWWRREGVVIVNYEHSVSNSVKKTVHSLTLIKFTLQLITLASYEMDMNITDASVWAAAKIQRCLCVSRGIHLVSLDPGRLSSSKWNYMHFF